MKYTTAVVAFAGVAAAQNTTSAVPQPITNGTSTVNVFTTLTICNYNPVTVLACPPTVVNCPANQQTPAVSALYVPVTTTICPVASVPAIVGALPPTQRVFAATGPTTVANTPIVTPGFPGPVSPVAPVPVAPTAPASPNSPATSMRPYTGAASSVSAGSFSAVFAGILAVLAF